MTRFLRRLRYWKSRKQMDADLSEELEFHRAMLENSGSAPTAMGNTTMAREDARAVWIWPWLQTVWQDAAYALRTMGREPGFTLTALLALGSAIGIDTGLFTIFNAVALKPWTVRNPSQVVLIHRFVREGGGAFGIAEYRYFAQHSQTFSGMVAMHNGERVKMQDDALQLTYTSGNYFHVLGVDMERGRGFLDQEDRVGAPAAVAVISHDVWQNRLGADPQILGRVVRLDGVSFSVVGVTPAEFTGTNPLRNDIWIPLAAKKLLRPNDPSVDSWLTAANYCCTPIAGRLAPGATRGQAQAELSVLLEQFRVTNGLSNQSARIVLAGTSWMDSPRKKKQVIPVMVLMFLAVTLVLLLACANVGNLLLARATARRQEIAVRLSLGGSRVRIIRQLLVESMLLAIFAAILGFATALVIPAAVVRRLAADDAFHVTPDVNVLIYTVAIAILACLAFGLAPALHGTRAGIAEALKAGVGPGAAPRARLPLRSVLLSLQVAISVVLLTNAGLLVHGMQRAQTLSPGFDVQEVSVVSIDLPASEYTGPRTRTLTLDLLAQLDRSRDLPSTGLVLNPPLGNSTYSTSFQVKDRANAPMQQIYFNQISGGYLAAVGMHLIAGRNFDANDTGRNVVMLNEAAAKRWWPGENPLGKTILGNGQLRQIVGIVSDTYTNDLSGIEAVVFYPITGQLGTPFIVVRDRSAASFDRITALVKQIEPRAQVRSEPLAASFSRQMEPAIHASQLAGFLGLMALAIASVGMFGVFAYVVGQRTREIGVRMALGAQAWEIVRLVLFSSAGALLSGLSAGMIVAAGISAVLAHALPGIQPLDPLAYANVLVLLIAAVTLASAVPARRATNVDPVRALRWD